MTKSQAIFIKFLRIRLGCSWRKVASHYFNRYDIKIPFSNKEYFTNQMEGRGLCRTAQDILNENWEDEC